MKIEVKVIPQSKKNLVKPEGNSLKIYVKAPAVEGKASSGSTG